MGARILAIALLDAFGTWLMMVTLGIAHGTDDRVPAFGLFTCFWLLQALGTIVSVCLIERSINS